MSTFQGLRMGSEIADIQKGLANLRRASKVITVIAVIGLLIFSVAVLACLLLAIQSYSGEGTKCPEEYALALLANILTFVLGIGTLAALALFFGEITRGESPFGQRCIKLTRVMSASFLAYALLEFLTPSAYFLIVSGADSLVQLVAQGYPLFHLNLTALFSAAVFSSLSFAFSYGAKLQQLSDDTV